MPSRHWAFLLLLGLLAAACGDGGDATPGRAGSASATAAAPSPAARAGRSEREAMVRDTAPWVAVCVLPRGAGVDYRYTVHNGPGAPVRGFSIGLGMASSGFATDAPDGGGELTAEPIGRSIDWQGNRGLYPPGVRSPPYWTAQAMRVENAKGLVITWETLDAPHDLAPGATLSGFVVSLAEPDRAYATGHWTLDPRRIGNLWGRLRAEPGCPAISQ